MTRYYRVSLGKGGSNASQAMAEGWVGTGFLSRDDLNGKFPDEWREFNRTYIPVAMEKYGFQSKVGAGLACGMTWTVCKGLNAGDVVLSANGKLHFQVGHVAGDYFFVSGTELPHRRPVQWLPGMINRSDMSQELINSISAGTVQDFTAFSVEIENLIKGQEAPTVTVTEDSVENPFAFVLEKYLEDFLVSNWGHTELGRDFEIYQEDGELVGQQYASDTGPIDILAISKDKKTLLVVELKRGKVSDVVVGQIQRYMGFVKDELVEPGQTVRGVIIGLDDDKRIQRALSVTQGIDFYKYEVNFKLHKA